VKTHELGEYFADLGAWGVELGTHPTYAEKIRHRPAVLPSALREGIQTHRAAILALLAYGYTPGGDDAAYIYNERLGIADGLGMATHTGSTAWLVAVGESIDKHDSSRTNLDTIHTVCNTEV